ncbi:methyltransferase domain-containing protein [Pandoraea sputorum]|uniref:Malonyl-[acyl-carrier protein] O-methyltransferase n=1 Tax=Pandoraea sputorum TaxID=93222 RepID=A0A5E5ARX1_9BURK|nr:methyltransferase domain-containing protein [Pandoraea sputorum]VVE75315.1 amidophosphoribosyltransferase [Pandoraea sputorum]
MKPSDAPQNPSSAFSARFLRTAFDRRAPNWQDADFLMREVASRLASRLDYIKLKPKRVLDAGCGTGGDLQNFGERYPDAYRVGLDASFGMAKAAAAAGATSGWRRLLRSAPPYGVVQADFAALPFASRAFDLVWSNLALHWYREPHRVIPEWHRVLTTDGLLMFSAYGPDTLRELRAAWAEVDGLPHALEPTDMHDLGDMMVASGFDTPVTDMERLTLTFESPDTLLRDVRLLGVNPQPERRQGLMGRARLAALRAALERQRGPDGTIALTFELVYGHAWKIPEKTDAAGNAVVRLQDIGRGGRPR